MTVYNFVMIAVLIILINIDYDDKQKILNNNQPVQKHLNSSSICIWSRDIFLFQYPRLGAKIDNYDHVIRINFPPTVGYEDFVGNKTTLFFGYLSSVRKSIDTPRQPSGAHILYSG